MVPCVCPMPNQWISTHIGVYSNLSEIWAVITSLALIYVAFVVPLQVSYFDIAVFSRAWLAGFIVDLVCEYVTSTLVLTIAPASGSRGLGFSRM
jgi:hypothetical protein